MINLIGELIVLGVLFYVINLIPMADPFPKIIKVVAILIAVVLILQFLGINLGLPLHVN